MEERADVAVDVGVVWMWRGRGTVRGTKERVEGWWWCKEEVC